MYLYFSRLIFTLHVMKLVQITNSTYCNVIVVFLVFNYLRKKRIYKMTKLC